MKDGINELRFRALVLGPSSNEAKAVHEYDKMKLLGSDPIAIQHPNGWLIMAAMNKDALTTKLALDTLAGETGNGFSGRVRLRKQAPKYNWIYHRKHYNRGRMIGRKFLADD